LLLSDSLAHRAEQRNSFIFDVLEQAKGIPITLCILLTAVCHRLGVRLQPVSFPMQFHLVLLPDAQLGPHAPVYIDAFEGGVLRSRCLLPFFWLKMTDTYLPSNIHSPSARWCSARRCGWWTCGCCYP
jgi:hypothetical protein